MTIPDYPDHLRPYDEYDPDRCPCCHDEECPGCDAEPDPYEADYDDYD